MYMHLLNYVLHVFIGLYELYFITVYVFIKSYIACIFLNYYYYYYY